MRQLTIYINKILCNHYLKFIIKHNNNILLYSYMSLLTFIFNCLIRKPITFMKRYEKYILNISNKHIISSRHSIYCLHICVYLVFPNCSGLNLVDTEIFLAVCTIQLECLYNFSLDNNNNNLYIKNNIYF